jgi:anti-anti-sigma factor
VASEARPDPLTAPTVRIEIRLREATITATCRVFRPEPQTFGQCEHHHRGRFAASHIPPSTVVITVEGEIDATNSRHLTTYIEGQVAGSQRLLLDLRRVEFFGTAGFAALHNINVICSQCELTWELRCDRQVLRLLVMCDPDGTLPVAKPQSAVDDLRAGPGNRELLIGGNN